MTRNIHCKSCGWKPMPMEDAVMGYKRRIKTLKSLLYLYCDLCGHEINVGDTIIADTFYLGEEPEIWEDEFGSSI